MNNKTIHLGTKSTYKASYHCFVSTPHLRNVIFQYILLNYEGTKARALLRQAKFVLITYDGRQSSIIVTPPTNVRSEHVT